jgi:hypothetical protein
MYGVIPAEPEHIDFIAPRMRKADVDEIKAASGKSPREALEFSLDRSNEAWALIYDGKPAAMFGVGWISILSGMAAPWLLGTDVVQDHYRHFLRGSRWWFARISSGYDVLTNIVDDRNDVSKRWLEFLGFTLDEPQIMGVERRLFRKFEWRAPIDV